MHPDLRELIYPQTDNKLDDTLLYLQKIQLKIHFPEEWQKSVSGY